MLSNVYFRFANLRRYFPFLLTVVIILPLWADSGQAQYRGDRPLEQTFEQSRMFFNPIRINPFGLDRFAESSLISFDHPLIDLQRNPAFLTRFDDLTATSDYLYLDFRNSRKVVNPQRWATPRYGRIVPGIGIPGFGYVHTQSRGEVAPLINAAYLSRPGLMGDQFSFGAGYQFITLSEHYYAVPRDIYRNVAGTDFAGVRMAGFEESDYDIEDRFSASDQMRHQGHSFNMFLGYDWTPNLSTGVQAGYFTFLRDGSRGSENLWNDRIDYLSRWQNLEKREQNYDHWDFSLGLAWSDAGDTSGDTYGLFAGLITGDVNQQQLRDDESVRESGSPGDQNWHQYHSFSQTDQQWDHTGMTWYGGIQIERELRENIRLRSYYTLSYSSQDLGLSSLIESESDNEFFRDSHGSIWHTESDSRLWDDRHGSGDRTELINRIQAGLNWRLDERQELNLGVLFSRSSQNTETHEEVDAFSERSWWRYSSTSGESESYFRLEEDKHILWDFSSRLHSVQIPVVYQRELGGRLDLLLGINRQMNFWRIDEEALILYDYRERVENDKVEIDEMTGERIAEPEERLSFITTSFLSGLTIRPAEEFHIQFIVSPSFERDSIRDERIRGIQFWMSLNLML